MARVELPSFKLPSIRLPTEHAVVRAVSRPFTESRSAASHGFSWLGNQAQKAYNAPLPEAFQLSRNPSLVAISARASAAQREVGSFFSTYEPLFGKMGRAGPTTIGGLASIAGGAVFAVLPVGGPEDEAARAIPEGVYGLRDGGSFLAGHAESEGATLEKAGADLSRPARAGIVDARAGAAQVGEDAAETGKSWYQALRPSAQFAAKAGVYGGAALAIGYGIQAAGSEIGNGLAAAGAGAGAGIAGLLGLGSGSGSGGASGGGSSGDGSSGSSGGLLGELTSSPLILLLVVGVGAYLLVKHEGKKSSGSSSPSSGAAS